MFSKQHLFDGCNLELTLRFVVVFVVGAVAVVVAAVVVACAARATYEAIRCTCTFGTCTREQESLTATGTTSLSETKRGVKGAAAADDGEEIKAAKADVFAKFHAREGPIRRGRSA